MTERRGSLLTAEEADTLRAATTADELETAARVVLARWVPAALQQAAQRVVEECAHGDYRLGTWEEAECPYCQPKARSVMSCAADYLVGALRPDDTPGAARGPVPAGGSVASRIAAALDAAVNDPTRRMCDPDREWLADLARQYRDVGTGR